MPNSRYWLKSSDDDILSKMIGSFSREVSPNQVDQIILECRCTDILQTLVDHCNSKYLKSFQLRFELDEERRNDTGNIITSLRAIEEEPEREASV
jgi:hypothetical protein